MKGTSLSRSNVRCSRWTMTPLDPSLPRLLGFESKAMHFRTDTQGRIEFMECNPNPAWSNDGRLAYMAGFAGIGYADLLRMILEAAQRRAAAECEAARARGPVTPGRGELSPPTRG